MILRGDALHLPLADATVDAIVTDPPYGLEFMGKDWDRPWAVGTSRPGYGDAERMARPSFGDSRNANCRACGGRQRGAKRCTCDAPDWDRHPREDMLAFGAWCHEWAAEAIRVLKPGGHLLAFGGARTWHRLVCAVEDAGFEIRDSIAWLYGSGFPKSLDVSKAIDAAAGAQREIVGRQDPRDPRTAAARTTTYSGFADQATVGVPITAPATDDARRWSGWGTALKPGYEPIVVARKPLAGTVAANVLAHGTGALNIDACRIGTSGGSTIPSGMDRLNAANATHGYRPGTYAKGTPPPPEPAGRWPSNVVLSHAATPDGVDLCADGCVPGCPVAELDAQSGVLTSGAIPTRRHSAKFGTAYGEFKGDTEVPARGADSGGASRFFPVFRYQAKAPRSERPVVNGVAHPTVKPLDLMRWLVRLVTPPGGGLILDPFAGSGTTAEACVLEGFRVIGIERDPGYLPLIQHRIDRARRRSRPGAPRPAVEKPSAQLDGQLDLLDLDGIEEVAA